MQLAASSPVSRDEQVLQVFSALGDRRRLIIVRMLLKRGSACVSDVAAYCHISVAAASQQLKVLEQTGLLLRFRDRQKICYALHADDAVTNQFIRILQL